MRDENHSSKLQQLRNTTHQNYGKTAEADFALAFTFKDMAETECRMGNAAHARELITQAWRALETAERYAAKADLPGEQVGDMQRQLNTLREGLLKLEEKSA
jgi:hypothetical protein